MIPTAKHEVLQSIIPVDEGWAGWRSKEGVTPFTKHEARESRGPTGGARREHDLSKMLQRLGLERKL